MANETSDYGAWQALVGAHTSVSSRFDDHLGETAGLSWGEFDVLTRLRAAGGRLRMSELADLTHASRSGLTRRVDRLQRRNLVSREKAIEDGRGQYAVLLPAGAKLHDECMPTHEALISEQFTEVLSQDELESLASLLTKISA